VNGRALVSEDVKFTFDRLVSGPFAYANFYTSIAGIETPDAQTVTVRMKAPDATFLSHLALGFGWIIPKEAGAPDPKGVAGLSFKAASTAIGTGPFMLDHYDDATVATFVRNPNYFEPGLPYLDSVKYLFLSSDPATQLAALQAGQADLGSLPAGSETDFKARNPKLVYSEEYSTQAWHHGMRIDHAPFSDVRVRHALAMAYSQGEVKNIWGTPDAASSYGSLTAVAGDGYLPAAQLGGDAKWWQLDLTASKQLLTAAGFPNGFTADYNDSDCCAATHLPEQFAADMAKAGIKVNVKVKPHPAYQASTARGDYEGIAGTGVQVYDPDDWFSAVLLPGTARNISHTDDPSVNDLTAKQRAEVDPQKRLDIVHQLVRYLAGQAYHLVEPQNIITHVQQPFVHNFALRVGYQPSLTVTWLDR
jgi:peptide/nickel transport system substrate-binding protein